LSFDVAATLRRLKPEKKTGTLARRGDEELTFADQRVFAGPPLLIDTTVYIDALQDRLPQEVSDLLCVRQVNHSSVAIAELAHVLGRLDPAHPNTAATTKAVQKAIAIVPAHRLQAPSVQTMAEAGILTGMLARLRGLPKTDKQLLFNDAMLFLQALEQGCHLLTRNIGDMDFLQQLQPMGRVLFYRQSP
jgi:predicted nucleic acid-binding protein